MEKTTMKKLALISLLPMALALPAAAQNVAIVPVTGVPTACPTLPMKVTSGTNHLYGNDGSGGCSEVNSSGSIPGVLGNVPYSDGAGGANAGALLNYLSYPGVSGGDLTCRGLTISDCGVIKSFWDGVGGVPFEIGGPEPNQFGSVLTSTINANGYSSFVMISGGTYDAPEIVQDTSLLYSVKMFPFDGTNYLQSPNNGTSGFEFFVDGTPNTGFVPIGFNFNGLTGLNVNEYWNDASKVFCALCVNVTDNAFDPASFLLKATSSVTGGTFSVAPDGTIGGNGGVDIETADRAFIFSTTGTSGAAEAANSVFIDSEGNAGALTQDGYIAITAIENSAASTSQLAGFLTLGASTLGTTGGSVNIESSATLGGGGDLLFSATDGTGPSAHGNATFTLTGPMLVTAKNMSIDGNGVITVDPSTGAFVSDQLKSTTGQVFVCADTTGKLVPSASACVGTI